VTNAPKKLLVVDDDVMLRTLLSQIFKERGYSVRSAPDGRSALAYIFHELPDILVTDLNMPGMSGFQLLREVHKYFPAIPVVVMTGDLLEDVARDTNAVAYYSKGASLKYLLRMVNTLANSQPQLPPPAEWPAARSRP
jgi:CheY-like chemotaxis protein